MTMPRGFRCRISTDRDAHRSWFGRHFPGVPFPGDHHTWWRVDTTDGRLAAWCSAVVTWDRSLYLSSAYVLREFRGAGLQRAMIRRRCAWARQQGVSVALTYTVPDNWSSAANLIREGFRVYEPEYPYVGRALYFQKRVA